MCGEEYKYSLPFPCLESTPEFLPVQLFSSPFPCSALQHWGALAALQTLNLMSLVTVPHNRSVGKRKKEDLAQAEMYCAEFYIRARRLFITWFSSLQLPAEQQVHGWDCKPIQCSLYKSRIQSHVIFPHDDPAPSALSKRGGAHNCFWWHGSACKDKRRMKRGHSQWKGPRVLGIPNTRPIYPK